MVCYLHRDENERRMKRAFFAPRLGEAQGLTAPRLFSDLCTLSITSSHQKIYIALCVNHFVGLVCFQPSDFSGVLSTIASSEVANFVYLRQRPNDGWQQRHA
jgi:hypothetical protein